jgi:hypothetical protein
MDAINSTDTRFQLGAERLARARALRESTAAELEAAAPDYIARFPLAPYIAELEHHGRPHRFFEFTKEALAINTAMHEAYPKPVVELYNRLLLAHLIETIEARTDHVIIPSVQPFVREDLDRVLKGLERPRPNYYLRDVHLFRRDLAIARLKVIPNGFEIYDTGVCIARSEALKGGAVSLWRFIRAFRWDLLAPLYPLYEPHWDRRYIRYFSRDEYERCCLRIADMMTANPQVRGIAVPSWWCDPQLKYVSPELAFIREIPESGGARFMLLEGDNPYLLTDALAGSPHRKALHQAGKYVPKSYMLVWPRRQIIAWAERVRIERPDFEAGGLKPAG